LPCLGLADAPVAKVVVATRPTTARVNTLVMTALL
jgi:hypothetical protein